MTQPALFIAHGSPTLAIEDNAYTTFLKKLGQEILRKPRAIVIFSAHWDSPDQYVTQDAHHQILHDYYGFPDELYNINYPVPGDLELSREIGSIFKNNNLPFLISSGRGLDHGAWVVLRAMFPNGDIPVVELSVDSRRSPEEQYAIGRMISGLREQNVLVIGSGGLVHNLRLLGDNKSAPADWAVEFDDWVGEQLVNWDLRSLLQYEKKAPHVRDAVPVYAKEHIVPLLYAIGAGDNDRVARKLFQDYQYGSLSLNCWMFGGSDLKI